MSRALTSLRDWAQKMADGERVRIELTSVTLNLLQAGPALHPSKSTAIVSHPRDRALWRQIADEIDAHLNRESEVIQPSVGQVELFPKEEIS